MFEDQQVILKDNKKWNTVKNKAQKKLLKKYKLDEILNFKEDEIIIEVVGIIEELMTWKVAMLIFLEFLIESINLKNKKKLK